MEQGNCPRHQKNPGQTIEQEPRLPSIPLRADEMVQAIPRFSRERLPMNGKGNIKVQPPAFALHCQHLEIDGEANEGMRKIRPHKIQQDQSLN